MRSQSDADEHTAQRLVGAVDAGTTWTHAGGSAGSGSAHENEPTFYDVAFIMKS